MQLKNRGSRESTHVPEVVPSWVDLGHPPTPIRVLRPPRVPERAAPGLDGREVAPHVVGRRPGRHLAARAGAGHARQRGARRGCGARRSTNKVFIFAPKYTHYYLSFVGQIFLFIATCTACIQSGNAKYGTQ